MRCLIVGNSPSIVGGCDGYDFVCRTGVPVVDEHTGTQTDMIVTRTRKYNNTPSSVTRQFKHVMCIDEQSLKPHSQQIIILSKNKLPFSIDDNILDTLDSNLNLNENEKPTLGMIAIHMLADKFEQVVIDGIETQYNSEYLDTGHYRDEKYRRVNMYHSLRKELLYINKLIRQTIITKRET